jgi:hypothetical protein
MIQNRCKARRYRRVGTRSSSLETVVHLIKQLTDCICGSNSRGCNGLGKLKLTQATTGGKRHANLKFAALAQRSHATLDRAFFAYLLLLFKFVLVPGACGPT